MFRYFEDFAKYLLSLIADQLGTTINVTGISDIDEAIPEYWADGILADGSRESFWGALSGKESDYKKGIFLPMVIKTGKLSQNGDTLKFNTLAQLMGSGVTGESTLKKSEEKLSVGTFTVSVDIVRHAVGITKKSTKQANFDEVQTSGMLLKDWMTRRMDNDAFTTILTGSTVETIYAGTGNTDVAELTEANGDYFGVNELEMMRLALLRQGAKPIQTTMRNGRTNPIYGCTFGEIEEFRLSQNTTFVQSLRNALDRFKEGAGDHPLFKGALGIYRNMILYPYYSMLPLPQGTPLRPETLVATTLTAGATTLTVGSSSDTTSQYTEFFAAAGSLQIEDEIISYSGKTSNTFTGLTRGASSTTAASHAVNVLITQRNVASVIGFGAGAIYRAIGDEPAPIGDKDDYGAEIGIGIEAYYGQSVRLDKRQATAKNLVIMKVYSKNPGTV